MSPRRAKKNAASAASSRRMEALRARQRAACLELLERWLPVAATEELAVRKEGRAGPIIDEEPLETALKAGAFVLKVLERLSRLDGLDAAERRELTVTETADPAELARRVQIVSPVLMARLALEGGTRNASPGDGSQGS